MDKLKAIETYVRIVRSGSLSEAARALGVTRSLASLHLKQLEEHLGAKLVNRTTRQLSLTDIGADYYEFCTRILEALQEKDAEIAEQQKSSGGQIKVLSSAAFAEFVLAPIVADFSALHPNIKISLATARMRSFSRELIEVGHDIALTMHPVEEASLTMSRIGQVRWRPYAAPSYLARRPAPQQPAELAEHDCICHHSLTPDNVWPFLVRKENVPITVSGTLSTNNVMILREFVLSGRGIGLLPDYCVREALQSGAIVHVLQRYPSITRDIYAIYANTQYMPKRTRLLLDFLRQRLRDSKGAATLEAT